VRSWLAIGAYDDDVAVRKVRGKQGDNGFEELTPAENHVDRFMKLIEEVGSVCIVWLKLIESLEWTCDGGRKWKRG